MSSRANLAGEAEANWLEIFSTYLEILSSDVEVIMEVELNEMKQSCTMPFKGSKELKLIEPNECRTLKMKIVNIGKTTTSNEKTGF